MRPAAPRHGQSGFALLLVFLLAAVIAISLYFEMPRVAFESQRLREQMAIDRGLQYQRAIQLFYRKFRTYPTTLDDLETTRNMRFLRRRYLDPMTGKAWRLVHVGPGGLLTDSNVKQATPQAQPGQNQSSGGGSLPGSSPFGSSPTAANSQTAGSQASSDPNANGQPTLDANGQPVNAALNMAARRPSDRVIGGGAEQPPSNDPNQQIQYPQPGQPQYPGQPGQPPQDPSQAQTPGQPGQPGQPQQPADPSQPLYPGQPVQAQYPTPGQIPPQTGYPAPPNGAPGIGGQPFNPLSPGTQPSGPGPAGQPNSAVNMIQQMLTSPRQPPSSTTGSVTTGGVGIAGVGGNLPGKGIHVIKDHSKYKEWEFIYDIKNDKTVVGAAGAAAAAQQQQQMQTNPNATGLQSNPATTATPTTASPTPSSPAPTTTSN